MTMTVKYKIYNVIDKVQIFLCCDWIVIDTTTQNTQVFLAVGGIHGNIKVLDLVERAVVYVKR